MPVSITADSVLFGSKSIRARQFTGLVEAHLARVPGTKDLEAETVRLHSGHFDSPALSHFIRGVYRWGGHPQYAPGVFEHNDKVELQARFRDAAAMLEGETCDVGAALAELNGIHGLGQPSYASRHLRFLCPRLCPVLDSKVKAVVGYEQSIDGYRRWAADSMTIARFLENHSIKNPMDRAQGAWFAGDVDMAVFAELNGWWL